MTKAKTTEPDVTPDFLAALKTLQADYDAAAANYKRAKEKASAMKKIADEAAEQVFAFIRGTDGEAPLFDREEDGDE